VFAVGIGDDVDEQELRAIASEPSERFMYRVGNFALLDTIKDDLAITACEGTASKVFHTLPHLYINGYILFLTSCLVSESKKQVHQEFKITKGVFISLLIWR